MASSSTTASGPLSSANQGWKAAATENGLAKQVRAFWQWWRAELTAAFAPLAKRVWDDPSSVVFLSTDGQQLEPLLTRVKLTGRQVRLRVADTLALQKVVTYPAAVAENLEEVIANDIDRQTPFAAEQTFHGARVLRALPAVGDDTAGRIEVALTVLPKRAISAPLAAITAAGGTVSSITLQGDKQAVELLSLSARPPKRLSQQQKINLVLLGIVMCALLALAVMPALLARATVRATTPLVGKAAAEAEHTRRIQTEVERLTALHDFAMSKKQSTTPMVEVLDELTKLSPDSSWLQNFEMKTLAPKVKDGKPTREIQLMGETASASKMIEALEASTLLRNAVQRAQTTRGSTQSSERFQVSTEVRPRPLPARIEIAQLTAPASPPASAPASAPPVPSAGAPAAGATPTAVVSPTKPLDAGKSPSAAPPSPPNGSTAPAVQPKSPSPAPPAGPTSPAAPPATATTPSAQAPAKPSATAAKGALS